MDRVWGTSDRLGSVLSRGCPINTEVYGRDYRFLFASYLSDNEIKGSGNHYSTAFRQYDPRIGRWFSVDPLAEEREWVSSYNFVQNNPINRVDLNGALDDWFQNELTGSIYYNSSMRKGDEGTGAMTGEGWVHMGENGMFFDGSPMTSDFSILMRNQGLGNVSMLVNYDKSPIYINAKVSSVKITGMFKGDNAQKLMVRLGYDFKPILFKVQDNFRD